VEVPYSRKIAFPGYVDPTQLEHDADLSGMMNLGYPARTLMNIQTFAVVKVIYNKSVPRFLELRNTARILLF
jgi:hypothetical protein